MSAQPEEGTERYRRAVYVLWSGHYAELTGAEARALVDSGEPLRGYVGGAAEARPDQADPAPANPGAARKPKVAE